MKITFFIALFLIILFIPITATAYTNDDLYGDLIENQVGFGHGYAIFELKNPLQTTLSLPYSMLSVDFIKETDTDINNCQWGQYKDVTVEKSEWIPDINCDYIMVSGNATNSTDDTIIENCTDTGYLNNYSIIEPQLFSATKKFDFDMPKRNNGTAKIRLDCTWDNPQEPVSIDWIPTFQFGAGAYSNPQWAWWNATWTYAMNITVNSSSNLTDYQKLINVTDTSQCQADCSDMRFTNSTHAIKPYWIESCAINNTQAWVKSDFTTNNDTQLIMFCGNTSDVSSASNGEEVDIIHDNFNDNSYNTSKWITYSDGGGTAVETGGALVISAGSSHSGGGSYSTIFPKEALILSAKWKVSIISSGSCEGNDCGANYFMFRDETDYRDTTYYGGQTKYYVNNYMFNDENSMRRYDVTDGVSGINTYTTASVLNTYYDIDLIITEDGYKTYKNDVLLYNVAYNTSPTWWDSVSSNIRIEFYNSDYARTAPITIDDVRVRKYTPTEPTYSLGSWYTDEEETETETTTTTTDSTAGTLGGCFGDDCWRPATSDMTPIEYISYQISRLGNWLNIQFKELFD